MVHEVADDDGTLIARTDIDAAMAGRVARRGGEPKRVVKLKVIVDQQRLTGRDHRLTVKPPDVSGWIVSALSRFLPGGVLELVKHVFCLRESRDPPPVAEQSIPAAVVDVQVCAEYVVDILEPQPAGAETVQPGLLWKVHRWRVALVLPSTGIHQNGTLGGTHYEGLISDHHASRGNIEYEWIELCDMPPADFRVVRREHVLRTAPRSVPFNDAGNCDVPDLKRLHTARSPRRNDITVLMSWRPTSLRTVTNNPTNL